jgi:invasion protein IalB
MLQVFENASFIVKNRRPFFRPMRAPRASIRFANQREDMPQHRPGFSLWHTRKWVRSLFPIACLVAGLPCAASPAAAQGAVKAKYGDWELRCETPPGALHEQCALLQGVADEERPNINLIVIILKTADGPNRLLRVIAPLGVLLPAGLGLKIDDADVGRAGFVRCLTTGCVAEVVMEEKLIDQMKNGKNATFTIFQTPEEGHGIPLTLNGFKEGFGALP